MKNEINLAIKRALSGLLLAGESEEFVVEHPANENHGDYSTNVALVLFGKEGLKEEVKSPRELAEKIRVELQKDEELDKLISKIEVAGAGFINFWIKEEWLVRELERVIAEKSEYGRGAWQKGKRVVVEYTDPNPFKEFHIGHLMSNAIGESVARLMEASGAEVKRVNYQGDVGMHVAKSIWGMRKKMESEGVSVDEFKNFDLMKKTAFMGQAYALGATAYEDDESVKEETRKLNKLIYDRSDEEINLLYDLGRESSLAYFETIYETLGTKFDDYYFESETGVKGLEVVGEGKKKGVFEESEGAVVFKGEKYGLHTRVFVNKLGIPTYEAKDLGLAVVKDKRWPYDLSLIVTANEIADYFKVILKAMEFLYPELSEKTKHLPHGMLKLTTGKMSSRTGKVITGNSLIEEIKQMVLSKMKESSKAAASEEEALKIAVGAIKFTVLKQGIGRDIIFNPETSLSFEGDSGPYIQYVVVRSRSVLSKAKAKELLVNQWSELNNEEKMLVRWVYRFGEVVEDAGKTFAPNIVADYLLELARRFNSFYNQEQIIGSSNEQFRLVLTAAVALVLENGLGMLGIKVPEKM